MSDILIRGMEMPTDCGKCFVGDRTICADGCPLVELPPHGDLIDTDFAVATYQPSTGCLTQYQEGWNAAMKRVDNSPVVIPSNKEETE